MPLSPSRRLISLLALLLLVGCGPTLTTFTTEVGTVMQSNHDHYIAVFRGDKSGEIRTYALCEKPWPIWAGFHGTITFTHKEWSEQDCFHIESAKEIQR